MARYMTIVLDTEKEGFHSIMKDLDEVIIGSAVGDELRRLEALEVEVHSGSKDLVYMVLVREYIKKVMYSNPEDYMECAGFKTRVRELKTLEDKIKKEYPDMYEAYYYEYL